MAIATRLDSPSHADFIAGKYDPVVRPDVTQPYRVTSARRHQRRATTGRPGVPKVEVPETLVFEALPELLPSQTDAPEMAPVAEAAVQPTRREPTTFSQPSWIIVAAVAATVGFVVWWVMFERLPDIDPRQVIATNLSAARQAIDEQHYVEPAERSAFHYYTTVLALDPANAAASSGIDRIADMYVEEAKTRLIAGRLADVGLALERTRRVRPEHPQLPRLNELLRNELTQILAQAHSQSVNAQSQQSQVVGEGVSKEPRVAQKRAPEAPSTRAVPAQAASQPIKLVQIDAARNLIGEAQANLGGQLLTSAKTATGSNDVDGAARTLAQAREIGSIAGDADAAESAPTALASAPAAKSSSQPKVIKFVQPEYPNAALMRGIEGWVDVSLQVAPSGDVIDPRAENSTRRLFERSALAAVRQWKYEPHTADDTSAAERLQVRVEFRLD